MAPFRCCTGPYPKIHLEQELQMPAPLSFEHHRILNCLLDFLESTRISYFVWPKVGSPSFQMLLSFWSISIAGSSTQPQPSCFRLPPYRLKALIVPFGSAFVQTTPCVHPPPCPGLHHLQLGLWRPPSICCSSSSISRRFPAPHVTKETPWDFLGC